MESTLLFFALPQEAAAFVKLGRRRGWPLRPTAPPVPRHALQRFVSPGLEVWVTGMGPENALRSGDAALQTGRPVRVFTCGVAGALNLEAQVGWVFHEADAGFPGIDRLQSTASNPGRMVTRDRVVVTQFEKAQLRLETQADLVDMESTVLRDLARARNIPSATVRSVSDTAHGDLVLDFNRIYTVQKTLHPGRLALEIARAPWKIPALIRFGGDAQKACVRLAEVLLETLV
ncbi:MAG: 5-methylthioadenosine/S-adenosylhomocysteine nucleosidase [Verrucomicrobiota bacterium]